MKITKLSVHCVVDDCRTWATQTVNISLNNKPQKHLPVCDAHYDAAMEDAGFFKECAPFSIPDAINDLKMYHGIPPHDGFNPCIGDNLFRLSIETKYKMTVGELSKRVKFPEIVKAWKTARADFIKSTKS